MSFFNVLIWILSFYAVYYLVIITYDAVTAKTIKETTGVEEFIVQRPDDKVVRVVASNNHSDYKPPKKEVVNITLDDVESGGSSTVAEKKN
ncbi:MAG: hypothetical protein LBP63_08200 [Prevotellaceae bacterium]|jgi:hypothetical protein|nr:hypothetical protein [Prevotellaceae bacterium]